MLRQWQAKIGPSASSDMVRVRDRLTSEAGAVCVKEATRSPNKVMLTEDTCSSRYLYSSAIFGPVTPVHLTQIR